MRLFVAINFNTDTRKRLIALREELRFNSRGGRFSLDENLHLTLVFIGEVSPKKIDKIEAILEKIKFEPFEVAIERIGCFKRNGSDIWWVGLRKDEPLMNLQREVTHKLALCGFEMDGRKYNPHITLGREVVTDSAPRLIESFGETVASIELMKSERINGKLTYAAIFERREVNATSGFRSR
jgi:2'-5' RNA ligase